MSKGIKSKQIFKESECKICKTKYPKYEVVKNEQIEDLGFYPDCDCFVEFRLQKWQIPILRGSVEFGRFLGWELSRLRNASEAGIDINKETDSIEDYFSQWHDNLKKIKNLINNQTGININYVENDGKKEPLNETLKFFDGEVRRRIKRHHKGLHVGRNWLSRNKK